MRKGSRRLLLVPVVLGLLMGDPVGALGPKGKGDSLGHKEFFKQELYISSSSERLEEVLGSLPNPQARESALAALDLAGEAPVQVFIDPRSGTAVNVLGAFPLIPGRGVGNRITLEDLGARTGRKLRVVDAAAVGSSVGSFAREHSKALGIDAAQLGEVRATEINPRLWQVSIPQTYKGVPVRYGRLAATINNGNLVLIGAETWGDVRGLSTVPRVSAEEAMAAGFEHADGRAAEDEIVRQPALEILPLAPPEHQQGEGFGGPVGAGYRHRLVWTFAFRRSPELATWEVIVDAHDGEVLAFQDLNQYADKAITGGVYPMTNTGICPTPQTCGTMQGNWPMPYADSGFSGLSFVTNSAGLYDFPGGTATTNLNGFFVKINDVCGAVSNSSTSSPMGAISLGGANFQTNCTSGGGSAGNTASSRTTFYEVNKIAEMAGGWLPSNLWLSSKLQANVNINQTCNAFWNGATINFYRSGGGCRNSGEIASIIDHEWGHGLDANDANGFISNSGEAYADIAAIYRLQTSCLFHGLFATTDFSCGTTADGTGFNFDEGQMGTPHCTLDCSGFRDADWIKHAHQTPDTALGFVCTQCSSGSGPCGRQTHCAGTPARQAAWDFAVRDLQAGPFNLDSQTAFIVANRIFYQGSGNIGDWHSCICDWSSSGCAADNAYMQWLAADDDDGNINNGTPHMTALYNAFNRHGIACASPTPLNSGCAGGPATAPTLTATSAMNNQVSLSWNAVSGATRYWVFRSEGHAGCNFGKAKIAETDGTTFTDTQVANGRSYYYNVVAAGSSDACHSRASNCLSATPLADTACRPLTLTHTGPGANPTAFPANSTGCATGLYRFDEFIQLTAAPASGYMAGSWTGTNDDNSVSNVNSVDMPASGRVAAVHYVQPDIFGSFDLQTHHPGLSLTGLWHRTNACAASASTALYYGVDAQCDYDTGASTSGTATFPTVNVTSTAQRLLLTYNYLLKTENDPGLDFATTEVSPDGGPYWLVARNNHSSYFGLLDDPSGGWQQDAIDLTGFATTSLRVRFGFDTVSSANNELPGFYLDDVQLRSIPVCQGDPDLVLTNQTITTAQSFEACKTINANTDFVIGSTGDVTFHAVDGVTLGAGFRVSPGGKLKVVVP